MDLQSEPTTESNTNQFYKCIEDTLELSKQTLIHKGKEYQRNDNPFHVYDTLRAFSPTLSREEIIWGMASKHFVSVLNIREDVKAGIIPPKEMVDEKYGDLINYLLIEKASIINKIPTNVQSR